MLELVLSCPATDRRGYVCGDRAEDDSGLCPHHAGRDIGWGDEMLPQSSAAWLAYYDRLGA